jgi:hypothetical protein
MPKRGMPDRPQASSNRDPRPVWREFVCAEGRIGEETYFVGAGGQLMPMLKGQPPPDLRYFK